MTYFQLAVNTFAFIGFLCTAWSVAILIALLMFKHGYNDGGSDGESS